MPTPTSRSTATGTGGLMTPKDYNEALFLGPEGYPPEPQYIAPYQEPIAPTPAYDTYVPSATGMDAYPSDSSGMYAAPVEQQYLPGGSSYLPPYQPSAPSNPYGYQAEPYGPNAQLPPAPSSNISMNPYPRQTSTPFGSQPEPYGGRTMLPSANIPMTPSGNPYAADPYRAASPAAPQPDWMARLADAGRALGIVPLTARAQDNSYAQQPFTPRDALLPGNTPDRVPYYARQGRIPPVYQIGTRNAVQQPTFGTAPRTPDALGFLNQPTGDPAVMAANQASRPSPGNPYGSPTSTMRPPQQPGVSPITEQFLDPLADRWIQDDEGNQGFLPNLADVLRAVFDAGNLGTTEGKQQREQAAREANEAGFDAIAAVLHGPQLSPSLKQRMRDAAAEADATVWDTIVPKPHNPYAAIGNAVRASAQRYTPQPATTADAKPATPRQTPIIDNTVNSRPTYTVVVEDGVTKMRPTMNRGEWANAVTMTQGDVDALIAGLPEGTIDPSWAPALVGKAMVLPPEWRAAIGKEGVTTTAPAGTTTTATDTSSPGGGGGSDWVDYGSTRSGRSNGYGNSGGGGYGYGSGGYATDGAFAPETFFAESEGDEAMWDNPIFARYFAVLEGRYGRAGAMRRMRGLSKRFRLSGRGSRTSPRSKTRTGSTRTSSSDESPSVPTNAGIRKDVGKRIKKATT